MTQRTPEQIAANAILHQHHMAEIGMPVSVVNAVRHVIDQDIQSPNTIAAEARAYQVHLGRAGVRICGQGREAHPRKT